MWLIEKAYDDRLFHQATATEVNELQQQVDQGDADLEPIRDKDVRSWTHILHNRQTGSRQWVVRARKV